MEDEKDHPPFRWQLESNVFWHKYLEQAGPLEEFGSRSMIEARRCCGVSGLIFIGMGAKHQR
jgi:hypothetical protein